MNTKVKSALASYGRSVLAGVATLYLAGVTDFADLAWSLLAAVLPVALRALNPNDPAFGKLPDTAEVDKAIKKAPAKKAPVKKTTAKKTAK